MKIKSLSIIVLSLMLNFVVIAQDSSENRQNTDFKAVNTKKTSEVYENKYYKFQMKLPAGWNKISADDSSSMVKLAKEFDTNITAEGKKGVERSIENSTILLHYTKHPLGTRNNSVLIGGVEKVENNDATTREIAIASELNFKQNFGHKVVKPTEEINLAGKDFSYFTLSQELNGVTFRQRMYLLKLSNTEIFQIIFTFFNESDLAEMEKAVKTLEFTK